MSGVVNTTHTFANNEVITSTLMNNIIDETFFTTDALANATLSLTSGKIKVATNGITSNEMATNAVTTTAIAANAITANAIAANAVTTSAIADSSITAPKLNGLQTGSAPIFGIRAYGAFNGTLTSPITPISSGNIASITRTSLGEYAVVMTTPMGNSNYCVVANEFHHQNVSGGASCSVTVVNSSSFILIMLSAAGNSYNPIRVDFVVLQ